jgi:hypothetical protein
VEVQARVIILKDLSRLRKIAFTADKCDLVTV